MPRNSATTDEFSQRILDLTSAGQSRDLPPEIVAVELRVLREQFPQFADQIEPILLHQMNGLRSGLRKAHEEQQKLRQVLEKLGATPWHPAVFLGPVGTQMGDRAMVLCGQTRRIVGFAEEVDPESLQLGDEVFLGSELNVVMAKSPVEAPPGGETAVFERRTDDGRLMVQWRDEKVLVDPAGALDLSQLTEGDLLRWNRNAWIAHEKIERPEGRRFLLDEVPDLARECVGGQDKNLSTLLSALTATLVDPDKAADYDLGGRQSILMIGPPGCGKTLMARVAAGEVGRISGKRCRFAVVKPAEWEDPYVGVTQQNIRNCFKGLREAASDGFAVLFMDEIEAAGRIRGGMVGQHSDKFLAALLAELDGFEGREGVAVIAASNRKDLVDPALLDRLSDVEIQVDRPNMQGAEAIFGIHLPPTIPYSPNGEACEKTRRDIITTAVSLFYSPNGESELCVIRFRDGSKRVVTARDLGSGRIFEQICRQARRRAFLRDVRGGGRGLRVEDIEEAVTHAMRRLGTTLSIRNAHAYLSDLPQDVDIVAVEPVTRKIDNPRRYMNADVS